MRDNKSFDLLVSTYGDHDGEWSYEVTENNNVGGCRLNTTTQEKRWTLIVHDDGNK